MRDAKCGMLNVGYWKRDVGCGMQDTGCEMWDTGCGMQDAGYRKQDAKNHHRHYGIEQKFGSG